MKAKELRIGNIALIENKEVEVDGKLIFQLEKANFVGCDTSDFKPMPLTEEWLLKFGFKSYDTPFGKLFEFQSGRYTWIIDNKGNLHLDYSEYENIANVQYVHQLQNLYFALTGEELTLKN